MNNGDLENIRKLYHHNSKHSQYQRLPDFLKNDLGVVQFPSINRYEKERWNFIKQHVSFSNKKITDIGGNQGYFSFMAIEEGAKTLRLIEGNTEHALFVEKVAAWYKLPVIVENRYFDFKQISTKTDILILLNVLHHIGDDYGQSSSVENARQQIAESLNRLASSTDELIFQLGFCWKGNRDFLLFDSGTKQEQIDFIQNEIQKSWEIIKIGIAENDNGAIVYKAPDSKNLLRRDDMGEFLNRPLFIMKSKVNR